MGLLEESKEILPAEHLSQCLERGPAAHTLVCTGTGWGSCQSTHSDLLGLAGVGPKILHF